MKNGDFHSVYGTYVHPSLSHKLIKERQANLCDGDIYVFRCEFIECKATGSYGGAICVSSSTSTKMLLESSKFIKCKTNKGAGAIYFSNNGNSVISKICGFGCFSTGSINQFDFVLCSRNISYKNHINDSTITHSISESCTNNLVHNFGFVVINNFNSSLNKCINNAGLLCNPAETPTENPISCILSFASFVNNTSSEGRIIFLGNNKAKKKMKLSNIIRNEVIKASTSDGIMHSIGDLTIKDSCILENRANYTFYEQGSSYTITVDNCTLDEDVESKKGSYVLITNKATKSFVHALDHISIRICSYTKQKRNFYQTSNIIQIIGLILIPFSLHWNKI